MYDAMAVSMTYANKILSALYQPHFLCSITITFLSIFSRLFYLVFSIVVILATLKIIRKKIGGYAVQYLLPYHEFESNNCENLLNFSNKI